MSIKREDERYNADPVKQLNNMFDDDARKAEDPDADGPQGAARLAPRLKITGDSRTPRKRH
jgi:hypothetical protein